LKFRKAIDMNKNQMKQTAAIAAIEYIKPNSIIGVGTGTTVGYFIDALAKIKHKIEGAVASSIDTEKRLRAIGVPILNLNDVFPLPLYIDSADEINKCLQMIKGGGGALTREKIIASNAQKFICIADSSKKVDLLGKFPVPIEVIPMARSYVAREIVKLGGSPVYRENVITDNGNAMLDIWNLEVLQPKEMELKLNNITGVVDNGIFATRPADVLLLLSTESGVVEEIIWSE
jgi:ribose 5-phosphate isomerase A